MIKCENRVWTGEIKLTISVGGCWPTWLAFNTSSIALTKLYERTFLEFESTGVIKCENKVWTDEIRLAMNNVKYVWFILFQPQHYKTKNTANLFFLPDSKKKEKKTKPTHHSEWLCSDG